MPEVSKPQPTKSVLRALPITHFILLGIIAVLVGTAAFFIPSEKRMKSESFIIPDEKLGRKTIIEVESGDNFSLVAKRAEIQAAEVFKIIESGEVAKRLLELYPGQKVQFNFDKYDQFQNLSFQPSLTETI